MSGKVTATTGEIGGYTIGTTKLETINSHGSHKFTSMSFDSADNKGIVLNNFADNSFLQSSIQLKTQNSQNRANMTLFAEDAAGASAGGNSALLDFLVDSDNPDVSVFGRGYDGTTSYYLRQEIKPATLGVVFKMNADGPFEDYETINGSDSGILFQVTASDNSTRAFIGKKDGAHLDFDGTNMFMSSSAFFLGSSEQFVSGSEGNIQISSSRFHLQPDGDVIMNQITASGARIEGHFTVTSGPAADTLDSIATETGSLQTGITNSEATSSLIGASSFASSSAQSASLAAPIAQTLIDSGSIASAVELTNEGMNILNSSNQAIAQYSDDAIIGRTATGLSNVFIDSSEGTVAVRKGAQVSASFGTTTTIGPTTGQHVKITGTALEIKTSANNTVLSASAAGLEMSGSIIAASGRISNFSITSGSIDSNVGNAKRGLKLEPGDSIRGYGTEVHSTTSAPGLFSFGIRTVAPPIGTSAGFTSTADLLTNNNTTDFATE